MGMRFEDLEAWREARMLTKEIYALTQSGPLSRDLRFCSQIQAAAVSVMSNIAEGFERTGGQEKLHFYNIARASCGELRSQLYVVEDAYPPCAVAADVLRKRAEVVGRLLSGLIASTRRRTASAQ
ncbi:MAG: four helix bundle protein [Chthoniobacterales bacterium]|nr:four helix bundle protein [Chthoniobacterales bacterium]